LFYGFPHNDSRARIEIIGFDETLTDLIQIWLYPILHVSGMQNPRVKITFDRFRQKKLGDPWIQEVFIFLIFFLFFLLIC
jgi:hypothetical protein